jgi:hypothetical protein
MQLCDSLALAVLTFDRLEIKFLLELRGIKPVLRLYSEEASLDSEDE